MTGRVAEINRETKETAIRCTVNLDEGGVIAVSTGIGFFDHLLSAIALHSGISLQLQAKGDVEVDDHHTVEDCAIVLGRVLQQALGDRSGIDRFGSAFAPLDEALARCVLDISGRPYAAVKLRLKREWIGELSTENLPHFFESLAFAAGITLHLDVLKGKNDHHKAEAAAKAFALALKAAVRCNGAGVLSTKGVLG